MEKKIKILTIHKDKWSFNKFRKKIILVLERKIQKKITNITLSNIEGYSKFNLKKSIKALKGVDYKNFDLIFIYGVRQIFIYQIYCKIYRIKNNNFFFFTGLGFLFTERSKLIQFLFFKILKFLLKNNDKIIVQNFIDHKIFIKKFPKNKIYLIQGNGISLKKANGIRKNQNFKKIIFGSRLINNKGIDHLINIINLVNASNIKTKYKFYLYLMVDENNPDKFNFNKSLSELKNTTIVFNKKNILKEINNSDLSIFTSYREGLSQFLLECISSNLPIIAFNVPGCSDLVRDKFNGYLIKKGDILEFVDRLILLLSNEKLEKKFKRNTKKIALNFTNEIIINKYLKLINES